MRALVLLAIALLVGAMVLGWEAWQHTRSQHPLTPPTITEPDDEQHQA